jgi:hypothetical protein
LCNTHKTKLQQNNILSWPFQLKRRFLDHAATAARPPKWQTILSLRKRYCANFLKAIFVILNFKIFHLLFENVDQEYKLDQLAISVESKCKRSSASSYT